MQKEFIPLSCSILTISDRRTLEQDESGALLLKNLLNSGHICCSRILVRSNIYEIRRVISDWISDSGIQIILTIGATGYGDDDVAHEAIFPLLDKTIDGFGELFRQVSYKDIGTSTIQSGTFGGYVNGTFVFCLPGSKQACEIAWNNLLSDQLDNTYSPCNFSAQLERKINLI